MSKSQASRPEPATCLYCEYDRLSPGFEAGGWIQHYTNGPIVPCQLCNPDGKWPVLRGTTAWGRLNLAVIH